jgi:hypothetical protein
VLLRNKKNKYTQIRRRGMKLSIRVLTILGLFMGASLVQTAAAAAVAVAPAAASDCAWPDGNCPETHAAAAAEAATAAAAAAPAPVAEEAPAAEEVAEEAPAAEEAAAE